MKKTFIKNLFINKRFRILSIIAVLLVFVSFSPIVAKAVSCSSVKDCQSQIDSLNNQNSGAQQHISGLSAQASSYQDAISNLKNQVYALQIQLNNDQQKEADLQQQMTDAQNKIDTKKGELSAIVKAMYIDGSSNNTIEELATSKDLSQFVDKDEFRNKVQAQLNDIIQQVQTLQKQLQAQKISLDQTVKSEQIQRSQLANDESQQASLLSYNQAQQDSYNAQIASNKSAIAELQREQYALNVKVLGIAQYGGTGGYPWSGAVQTSGTYNWVSGGGLFDPLGWNYRNCTSYAFWRLGQARGILLPWYDFPGVYSSGGRIGYSIPDFEGLGYNVDHNPKGSTLAVFGAGEYGPGNYGHIMYVESSDSNSAYVSQYNEAGDGRFSTMTVNPSSGVWFIHIP